MLNIITKILILLVMQNSAMSHEECAVEQVSAKYKMFGGGGTIIANHTDIEDTDQCFQVCCKLAKSDGCNAASIFRYKGKILCLSIKCQPHFKNCTWEETFLHEAFSAEIKLYDSSIPIPNNGTQGNATINPEEAREYMQEIEDELQKKKDDIFQNDNPLEKWKIDYNDLDNLQPSTTTEWMGNAQFTTTEQPTESKTTKKPEVTEQGGQETKTPAQIQNKVINKPPPENIANKIDKPHTAHGNSGIYGPNEVEDYDYSATPLIVIGAVITVLFLLMVLICVGRKLSASERLKYRPLRDSFPASNSYHDME